MILRLWDTMDNMNYAPQTLYDDPDIKNRKILKYTYFVKTPVTMRLL